MGPRSYTYIINLCSRGQETLHPNLDVPHLKGNVIPQRGIPAGTLGTRHSQTSGELLDGFWRLFLCFSYSYDLLLLMCSRKPTEMYLKQPDGIARRGVRSFTRPWKPHRWQIRSQPRLIPLEPSLDILLLSVGPHFASSLRSQLAGWEAAAAAEAVQGLTWFTPAGRGHLHLEAPRGPSWMDVETVVLSHQANITSCSTEADACVWSGQVASWWWKKKKKNNNNDLPSLSAPKYLLAGYVLVKTNPGAVPQVW